MYKKTLAWLLTLVLLCGAASPALAADTMDSRLAAVTLAVKKTLGIADEYTSYHGEYNDWSTGGSVWNLSWSSDTQELRVEADEKGKIYNYYHYLTEDYSASSGDSFAPIFPSVTREEAKPVAEAFLKKVLSSGEGVRFEEADSSTPRESTGYSFRGVLQYNGVDTQSSVYIQVRTSDRSVQSFSRDDGYTPYVGTTPSATPAVSAERAKTDLLKTVGLDLRYVIDFSGETPRAVLRYVPVIDGTYYVDAHSGKLVDMSQVYDGLARGGGSATNSAAPEMAGDSGKLSDAEQAGVDKLTGVLSRDELDSALRGLSALGVSSAYTLRSAAYHVDTESEDVTASLNYYLVVKDAAQAGVSAATLQKLQKDGYTPTIHKYATLDAKTGTLLSLHTSYSGFGWTAGEEGASASLPQHAQSFLQSQAGELLEETKQTDAFTQTSGEIKQSFFRYTRAANGYLLPENTIELTVNTGTGYVDTYWVNWTQGLSFDSTDGLIGQDAAAKAYAGATTAQLSYINMPVAVDPGRPEMIPYINRGYGYVYELRLMYLLTQDGKSIYGIFGIDAKTGQVLQYESDGRGTLTYDDLQGHYAADKIKALAQYGIGFYGGSFLPAQQLDQRSMLLLLISTQGYIYTQEELDDAELKRVAVRLKLIAAEEFAPDTAVTRAQLVKTLVTLAGYGEIARIPDIFVCGFSDDKQISRELYGYVAIAKGLGIVSGYPDGSFRPDSSVTRGEAAVMLYQFMARGR